jgi:hypothetical protein
MILLILYILIFFIIILILQNYYKELRFKRLMQEEGRFLQWVELSLRLDQDSGGTIILNGTALPGRVWWTPRRDIPQSIGPSCLSTRNNRDLYLTDCPGNVARKDRLITRFPGISVVCVVGRVDFFEGVEDE